MLYGTLTTPPWPEAVRDMPERGFKKRLDDLFHGTLYNTVFYGSYPQGPELPRFTGLGYPPATGGTRYIGTRSKLFPYSLQVGVYPKLTDMLHGNPVNTRSSFALIGGNCSPGTAQVAAIGNPVPQLTVLPFGVLPTPLIEFSLHVEQPGLISLCICVHRFLRHRKPIDLLSPFALWTALSVL